MEGLEASHVHSRAAVEALGQCQGVGHGSDLPAAPSRGTGPPNLRYNKIMQTFGNKQTIFIHGQKLPQ